MLCGCGLNISNQHWSIVAGVHWWKYVAAIRQLGWTAKETLHSSRGLKCRCKKKKKPKASFWCSHPIWTVKTFKKDQFLSNALVQPLLWSDLFATKNFLWSYERDGWFVGWLGGSLPRPLPNNQTHKHNYSLFLSGGGNTDSNSVLSNRDWVCTRKA